MTLFTKKVRAIFKHLRYNHTLRQGSEMESEMDVMIKNGWVKLSNQEYSFTENGLIVARQLHQKFRWVNSPFFH